MWYWRVSWVMWLLMMRTHRLIRLCSPKRTSVRCATLEFGRILRGNIVVKTTLLMKQEFSEWSCYNLVLHDINMYCDNQVIADLTKVFTVHGIASKYYVHNVSVLNRSHLSDWGQVQNPRSCCGWNTQHGAGSSPAHGYSQWAVGWVWVCHSICGKMTPSLKPTHLC